MRLHGLWLPQPRADAPLLLYLHGARWDVRGSAFRMRRMHELGFAVLGIDYRGFGQSTDTLPSETMAYEDARAAWDWLAQQHPGPPRYVFGHSLGSAIAVQLASQVDDESGVLVEGSFTSLPDVVSSFKWGWLPVGPLITQRFDAGARVDAARLAAAGGARRPGQPDPAASWAARCTSARASPSASCWSKAARTTTPTRSASAQYREAVRELFGLRQSAHAGTRRGRRRRSDGAWSNRRTMSDRPTLKLKPGAAARNPQRLRVRATTAPRKAAPGRRSPPRGRPPPAAARPSRAAAPARAAERPRARAAQAAPAARPAPPAGDRARRSHAPRSHGPQRRVLAAAATGHAGAPQRPRPAPPAAGAA